MSWIRGWWYLSAVRRWMLRDPGKIDAYNAAVDAYNRAIDMQDLQP